MFEVGAMKINSRSVSLESILRDFENHLSDSSGLAPATCRCWVFYTRGFLRAMFGPSCRRVSMGSINSRTLLDHVMEMSKKYPPLRLQSMGSALRSFCRFLQCRGYLRDDLSQSIPRIGCRNREYLPDYLTPDQVESLLDSANRSTRTGKRDFAILLMLSRLGLRANEVSRLTLEQIDWSRAVICLRQTKGRRERSLPLSNELGKALVDYLQKGRPRSQSRHFFLNSKTGGCLSPGSISTIVRSTLKRVGLSRTSAGSHLLRRSVATNLVQNGVSLKAVADLLGHLSLSTTQIYAKVNLPMLREVSMPWPVEVKP